jgi:hypothetical protein
VDYPRCDAEVKKVADKMWGNCDGIHSQENRYGKGRVVLGESLAEVFEDQNLKPDFEVDGQPGQSRLAYAHRIAGEKDIYFVSNQRREFDSAACTFRVNGRIPELWHADTGIIEPAPVWNTRDGRTTVRLDFEPAGSVFVIFRHSVKKADHVVAANGRFIHRENAGAKIEVKHAVYTATDGAGEADVTAKISELIRGGELNIGVSNDELGGDPAAEHRKELRVDYTFDGKSIHTNVPENDTFTIATVASTLPAPSWELKVDAAGTPMVKAWENGSIDLHTAEGKVLHAGATDLPAPTEIAGGWNLSFPPNWGAPPSVTLDKLISWTDHTNAGVRYFSGTAAYDKEIEIPSDRLAAGREVWIDLGAVKNFAEVTLNGQSFGVLWKPPFRVNVTAAAKAGSNKLVVKITNLWPNRLIGDEQLESDREWNGKELVAWPEWMLEGKPSPTGRFTFTTWHHWTKDSPLLESGLLGPVQIRTAAIIPAMPK